MSFNKKLFLSLIHKNKSQSDNPLLNILIRNYHGKFHLLSEYQTKLIELAVLSNNNSSCDPTFNQSLIPNSTNISFNQKGIFDNDFLLHENEEEIFFKFRDKFLEYSSNTKKIPSNVQLDLESESNIHYSS